MKKIYIITFVLIIAGFAFLITSGCSKPRKLLFTAPLCDCNYQEKTPQSSCHSGEVCDSHSPCVTANTNSNKCISANEENRY